MPFVLATLVLVALRFLFAVPTELAGNRVFRMSELDDKAAYLDGSRKAMWMLGTLPIALATFPRLRRAVGTRFGTWAYRVLAARVRMP